MVNCLGEFQVRLSVRMCPLPTSQPYLMEDHLLEAEGGKSQLKESLSQTSLIKKRPLALCAPGSKRLGASTRLQDRTLPSGGGGSATGHALLQPDSVQGYSECPSSSSGVLVGAPRCCCSGRKSR